MKTRVKTKYPHPYVGLMGIVRIAHCEEDAYKYAKQDATALVISVVLLTVVTAGVLLYQCLT